MKLLKSEQTVYDRIYSDLLEPDQLDREIVTQISKLTVQVNDMSKQIRKDGAVYKYTTTKGTEAIKAHPLTDTLKQLQSNLATQLNKLAVREDNREKMLFKRAVETAEHELRT